MDLAANAYEVKQSRASTRVCSWRGPDSSWGASLTLLIGARETVLSQGKAGCVREQSL